MKIAVCIKQVPTREWQPRLNDTKTWIREQEASYEMNEPDAYALEEGLRLREKHSGEDVALGAADAFTAAQALVPAMKEEGFDLILTGLQSDDQGHAQFGPVLAEKLGVPHSTIIMEVVVESGSLK